MSKNILLVVGAGPLQCYAIREAQALGLSVLATDRNDNAPGFSLADTWKPLDIYDIEGHRRFAAVLKDSLAGIICCGGDAAPTVSACYEAMGRPWVPYDVACKTWNKAAVRACLDEAGLAHYQPQWFTGTELTGNTWTLRPEEWGCPVVIKPVSQRASRGVTIVDTIEQAEDALRKAWSYDKEILIEERLIGTEHSAEVLFDRDGACVHFHVCDRFFDYANGVPLEIGHINPSRLTTAQQAAVKAMLLESAAAMKITIGSFKIDVVYTKNGPRILECTARCSGGYDAQLSYPRSSGDNLLRRAIQVACGAEPTRQPPIREGHYCAVASIIPRKAGVVSELPMLGGEILWAVKPGETVQPPMHCAERAGFVVVEGKSHEPTWLHARAIAEMYEEALAGVTR